MGCFWINVCWHNALLTGLRAINASANVYNNNNDVMFQLFFTKGIMIIMLVCTFISAVLVTSYAISNSCNDAVSKYWHTASRDSFIYEPRRVRDSHSFDHLPLPPPNPTFQMPLGKDNFLLTSFQSSTAWQLPKLTSLLSNSPHFTGSCPYSSNTLDSRCLCRRSM